MPEAELFIDCPTSSIGANKNITKVNPVIIVALKIPKTAPPARSIGSKISGLLKRIYLVIIRVIIDKIMTIHKKMKNSQTLLGRVDLLVINKVILP